MLLLLLIEILKPYNVDCDDDVMIFGAWTYIVNSPHTSFEHWATIRLKLQTHIRIQKSGEMWQI